MLRQPDHHWWLVNASDVGLMLNQLCKEPEGRFLVAVVHQRRHDEVHALHVADRVVKVAEGAEDAAEAVVHRGLYLCEVGHVKRELRHLRESAQRVFLDVRIECFQLRIGTPTLLDVPIIFRLLCVIILVVK